ncbi:MAG: hypothetical protein EHM33_03250 [Chloroflexi bacterium]|nr:MAG: hypothetical protein EHM33_03250 [Chloroflexota bacterium]
MIEAIFSMPLYITMPATLIGYSMTCLGTGILILRLLAARVDWMERISAGTILATAFILGEGILASLWLLLALGGWFSTRVVGILCFVFAVAGLSIGRSLFSGLKKQIASIWRELREDTWGWQLLAGLTVFLCLLCVTSLGRPLAGDGPAFYLALGKFIASSNHLIPMPGYEAFTNVGLQGELHFAALMALRSPDAAKLFPWLTAIMAGIMLASLGRVVGMGRRGQWLTLSMLFSSSAVIWLSGDGKVDLFAVGLGLAAYYWAVQIRFTRIKLALLLTGLFSGFSIVAKLSYAPVMVPTIVLLVLWGYSAEFKNRSQWPAAFRSFTIGCMVILAGLILALIPHFVKNGLLYHNPISPIGSGGIGWLNQTWFGPAVTRWILLTYPFALTYGSYWAQYGNLSPLILAFLPLMFYLPRPRPFFSSPLVVITLVALVGVLAWIIYSPSILSPRYILATLLLLILLPARSAEYVSLNDQRPRLLAAGVIISTTLSLAMVGLYFLDPVFLPDFTIKYLIRPMDECDRDGRSCWAMESINRKAEAGSRVYVASYEYYWLRGDLMQCVSTPNDTIAEAFGHNLWLALYEKGVKFLVINKSTHSSVLERLDLQHLPQWVELKPLYEQDPLYAYCIKFKTPPSNSTPLICRKMPSSPAWEIVSP